MSQVEIARAQELAANLSGHPGLPADARELFTLLVGLVGVAAAVDVGQITGQVTALGDRVGHVEQGLVTEAGSRQQLAGQVDGASQHATAAENSATAASNKATQVDGKADALAVRVKKLEDKLITVNLPLGG